MARFEQEHQQVENAVAEKLNSQQALQEQINKLMVSEVYNI